MKILVTGSAGFIGSELSIQLLNRGDEVVGIDNHNNYYDPSLKEARLQRHESHPNYTHLRMDISDGSELEKIFKKFKPQRVVNLAAQAGVRYSLTNPAAYIDSNLVGFANILEGCRNNNVEHLVYASSSSVYGANTKMPYSVHDNVDHPISLYAATKKSNELMSHSYSHLYNLPATGLRFFTVYGPWDRPDMALQKFTKSILQGKSIDVYNYGNHRRDFTFIDDIILGIIKVLDNPAKPNEQWNSDNPDSGSSNAPWRIYNIGRNGPVKLLDYIKTLELALGVKAVLNLMPMQPGDVPDTFADVDSLVDDLGYRPSVSIEEGIMNFADWFRNYYQFKM